MRAKIFPDYVIEFTAVKFNGYYVADKWGICAAFMGRQRRTSL